MFDTTRRMGTATWLTRQKILDQLLVTRSLFTAKMGTLREMLVSQRTSF
jgi:hypothetical protein